MTLSDMNHAGHSSLLSLNWAILVYMRFLSPVDLQNEYQKESAVFFPKRELLVKFQIII
jgi:hypothetical protein